MQLLRASQSRRRSTSQTTIQRTRVPNLHVRQLFHAGRTGKGNVHHPGYVGHCSRHDGSNQCGGKGASYIRSLGGGRTLASLGTEEGDLPHRWRTSDSCAGRGVTIRQKRRESVIECRPKYSSPSMGPVENMNKELWGLVRCFRIHLRVKAKMEVTTESPLLPWLVRHCEWILSRYAVRADGRTGYSRLKGGEYTAYRYSEKQFGTSCPRPLNSRNSTTAGALRSCWESRTEAMSTSSDWRMGAVLARSVRRKVEGKRWNERALKMVTGTPWKPRPGEVVVRRRYITRALIERYGPTKDCGGCFRKSQQHSERWRARFEL